MSNSIRQNLTLITAAILVVACGSDSETDDRSNAVAQSARTDTACQALRIDDVEQFTSNDYLFFSLVHPEGWLHKPASSGLAGHGYVSNPENEFVLIEYNLTPIPMPKDGPATMALESSGNRLESISYGGIEVQPYGKTLDRNATLGLMLPHGDDYYNVTFLFHGRKGCDTTLVVGLRTSVLESLASNQSTSFGN